MFKTEQGLLNEVASLREEMAAMRAALGRRVKIEIETGDSEWLLGQPVTLDVTVRDPITRQPLPGLPVSAITNWGSLTVVKDARRRYGSAITARTGIDGRVRLVLSPAAAQFVDPQAQTALQATLDKLSASAQTPADDRAGLAFLTRQYRWEPNVQLRSAVDAYFQFHRNELAANANNQDALKRWQTIEATVQIAVLTDGANTGGAALQLLSFKNWIPPWLQSFRESARAAGELEGELEQEKKRQGEPNRLLDGVYERVRRFVDRQYGVVGEYMGQRVAKEALRTFLTTGIDDLPDQTKQTLFPAVRIASATVERDGVNVLNALTQARVDLRQEVDAKVAAIDLSAVDALGGRVDSLETSITAKLDASAFDAFRLENAAVLDQKVNTSVFTTFQQTMNSRFDEVVVRGDLEGLRADVKATLNDKVGSQVFSEFQEANRLQLEARVPLEQFEDFQSQTATRLSRKVNTGTFNSFQQTVNGRFDEFIVRDELEGFQAEVKATLNDMVAIETFAAFEEEMGARLEAKADLERLVEFQQETAIALESKLDSNRFGTFERDLDVRLGQMASRSSLELFQEETKAALEQKVSATDFERFQESNAVRLRQKADRNAITALDRELSTLTANVKELDQNVIRVSSNVRLTPGVTIRPIFP